MPVGFHDKCPISVSFVAKQGGDRFLLDTIQTMYADLQEQAKLATKASASGNTLSKETSAEMAKEKVQKGKPAVDFSRTSLLIS